MARALRTTKRNARMKKSSRKLLKTKSMGRSANRPVVMPVDPAVQAQLKLYEEAVRLFQQQKFHRAQQVFVKVTAGVGKELSDRAQMHLRICEQRISRMPLRPLK